MSFISIEFIIFLPIVFILYWAFFNKQNVRVRNIYIVAASYIFYGWWDYRFLLLIVFTSIFSYFAGTGISKNIKRSINSIDTQIINKYRRRAYILNCSNIIINIGILCVFKYYNFFISEFVSKILNFEPSGLLINFILPIGISFYTFQALSYTIDIYKNRIKPCTDITAYMAYISFFPQLVAGPIERASYLLPQFETKKLFDYKKGADGMRQILWGLLKKIVIANPCARYVEFIFDNYTSLNGSTLLLGACLFTIQIYCDFSGYSDMAVGLAKLFGINLSPNFKYPYFAQNIGEFWRRWHVSLTAWFKDYIYIPLGGSRTSTLKYVRNILIVFLLSGLWHGANWSFMLWGLYNGVLLLLYVWYYRKWKKKNGSKNKSAGQIFKQIFAVLSTISLVTLGRIIYRSASVGDAFNIIKSIFSNTIFSWPSGIGSFKPVFLHILIPTAFLFGIEWFHRNREHGLEISYIRSATLRWSIYYILVIILIFYYLDMSHDAETFIYFQF